MFFFLKKHVASLLFPVPLSTLVLVAGIVLLWRAKRMRAGRALASAGAGLLLLAATPPLPDAGMGYLQGPYHTYTPAAGAEVRWIVVLGGGATVDPSLPPTEQLSRSSLIRLVEGIRILGIHPEARLLLSGGCPLGSRRSEGAIMADAARLLGVSGERIALEEASWDTEGQAVAVKKLVGDDAFALVTTASHLRRATALFRAQGLTPIPAPAEWRLKEDDRSQPDLRRYYPNPGNLDTSTTVVYELLGIVWSRLRGKV